MNSDTCMFQTIGLAFRLTIININYLKYAYMMVNDVSVQIVTFYMYTI